MAQFVGWHTTYNIIDREPTKDELVDTLLQSVNEYCLFRKGKTLDQVKQIISKIENVEQGHI